MDIGKILKRLRKERELSQEELCNEFSKRYALTPNKSMMSRWENGTAMPDAKHILAYARFFLVDINYLYGIIDKQRKLEDLVTRSDVALHDEITESNNQELLFEIIKKLKGHDENYLKHLLAIL